jgi:hypothetical protein
MENMSYIKIKTKEDKVHIDICVIKAEDRNIMQKEA